MLYRMAGARMYAGGDAALQWCGNQAPGHDNGRLLAAVVDNPDTAPCAAENYFWA